MRKTAGIYKDSGKKVIDEVQKEFGVELDSQQASELGEVLHDVKVEMGAKAERFTDFDWAEVVFNFLKDKGLVDLNKGDSWTNYVAGSLQKEAVGGVAFGKTIGNDVKKWFGVELDTRGIEELTQVISRKMEYFKSGNRPFTKVEWMETAFEYLKDNGLAGKEHWIDYIKGAKKEASESGEHFGDFLKTHSVDCDIIIGGAEMPAGFVWDKDDMGFTEEGQKVFAEILNAPYEVYDNGNIEVKSKSWQLGEDFVWALGGYVSISLWNKWFIDKIDISSGKIMGKDAAQPYCKDEEAIRDRLKVLYRILDKDNNWADRSEAETLEKKLQGLKKKDIDKESTNGDQPWNQTDSDVKLEVANMNVAKMGMKPQNKGNFDEYEVRDAANTIAKAEEHKANKPLMKAVQAHVKSLSDAVGGK